VSLVELLLAISITTIIMVPIGGAIWFGLRTTGDTQTRLAQSNKADSFAALFVPDVQSTALSGATSPGQESATVCGNSATTVDLLLTQQPGVSSVSYYRVTTGTGANRTTTIYRRTCNTGVASVGIPVTGNFATPPAPTPGNPFSVLACGQDCTAVQVLLTQQDTNGKNSYPTNIQATLRVN
jgi:hypothetical protein